MKKVRVYLKSVSPYSQSKQVGEERLNEETGKDFEKRTWKQRCHVDKEGNVIIPPMVFKNCLSEAAKFMSLKIPGKGKATYTKHFEAGVMVTDALKLPIKIADVQGEWHFVPSDGVRGGGKRVEKCFPLIDDWEGVVEFHMLDETITEEVFEEHLKKAGQFIGIGRFRPRNNGWYGRFTPVKYEWSKEAAA